MAKPLALTLGEPAGIGPDIAIKAWLRRNELKLPAFYLLGDRDFVARRADILGLDVDLADVAVEKAASTFARSTDRKSTRLNSSHRCISYAVFCLKKKNRRW